MLKVEDIHTYYGRSYVLQGIGLEVGYGDVVAILGRNGMGKTTLMSSIIGFNHPRRGKIMYRGEDVTYSKPYRIARQGISLVPQGRQIFPSLTVEENLKVVFSKREGEWDFEKIYEVFPFLKTRRRQMGDALSGGEQQMLAIARCLMTNPSLLLMDEPTEGLSPLLVHTVGGVVRQLHDAKISILLVEQKLAFALRYTDYIHIMVKGKMMFSAPPKELEENHEVLGQYLGI